MTAFGASPVIATDGPVRDNAPTKEAHSTGKRKLDKRPDGRSTRKAINVSLSQIIAVGLLRTPVRLFRKYKGKDIEARLMNDGSVEFQKTRYDSCSTAAEVARSTVTGRRMNTNGWSFWCYQDANGKRTPLNTARVAYIAQRGA